MGWFVRDSGLFKLLRATSDGRLSRANSRSDAQTYRYDAHAHGDPTP
jgi:hypothetical protein